MEYRVLGRSGVRVSRYCLGAMMFGSWGNGDTDECIRVIHHALEAGINFIDTSDNYSGGESEEIVGRALGGRREDVVLATKAHMPMGSDPNMRGNSRRWLVREVENSLRRLQTDWIDLYQLHRSDPETDIDETLGALTDLVRAGKIRYAGTSTFPPSRLVDARHVAERRGHIRFVSEQPPYSMLARGVESELLPVCLELNTAVMPWGPLAGGWLSGRFRRDGDPTSIRSDRLTERYDLSRPEAQRKLDAAEALDDLAREAGLSLVHMGMAFVSQHPAVTAPIIGPRTLEQLEGLLAGIDVRLDDALLDRIDAIVPPGTNIDPGDAGWRSPALANPALRRTRPL